MQENIALANLGSKPAYNSTCVKEMQETFSRQSTMSQ